MKKNSLNINIWKYFLVFSILILVFLWIFQILFLKNYYRYSKTKDINLVSRIISRNKNSTNLEKIMDKASISKDVCIEIVDNNLDTLYTSSYLSKGCFSGREDGLKYKYNFVNSNYYSTTYEVINPTFNNQTLIKALKLSDNRYAFINTSMDPIDGTTSILQNQLIIVSFIVLILSFVIAFYISNRISKPIVKMNESAKRLAKGDFNVVFNNDSEILELEELSNTLNYAKDELYKTDEVRRDLMANVSHDLKTPLTMIKAYAEVSTDLHSNNPKKQKEDMNIIINEVDRLTLLVNDILDLSSMQSNMEEVNKEEFNLVDIIKDIFKKYQYLKDTENYNFIYTGPNEVIINADKKKMYQVIYNLVNNAINYTGSDNKVEVKIEELKNKYIVKIIDTGLGIKDEDIDLVWDKYYKNKKKHKRNLVGTGLGLSIVKNIFILHNYKYGVNSSNKGTTFYFEIKK